MDFFTTANSPVLFNINGTAYNLPRFLNPAFKKWGAEVRKDIEDNAAKDFDPDGKARFLIYFQPVVDIVYLTRLSATPDGAEYIASASMKAGGVPDDLRKAVLEQSTPDFIAQLARKLLEPDRILSTMGAENTPDPLRSTPVASEGSPATGAPTTPDSAPSTPA